MTLRTAFKCYSSLSLKRAQSQSQSLLMVLEPPLLFCSSVGTPLPLAIKNFEENIESAACGCHGSEKDNHIVGEGFFFQIRRHFIFIPLVKVAAESQ